MWLPPLLFYLVGYLVLGISGTGVAPDAEHPQDTPALDVWPTPGTMASPDLGRVVAMMTTPLLAEDLLSWTSHLPGVLPRGLRCLWAQGNGRLSPYAARTCDGKPTSPARRTWLLILLLLMSGNVKPNPGPELSQLQTPEEFRTEDGLRLFHLNVRSMINKMDSIRIWADSTDSDIIVLSETWLKKSITNDMINIKDYNVFRTDRVGKGGGVAIYVKNHLDCTCIESLTKPKCFELSVIKLLLPSGSDIIVVGCYHPPAASSEATNILSNLLHNWTKSEMVLLGDLNWDWQTDLQNSFKDTCDSLCLVQLVNSPTRLNQKDLEKSTLIDVILTNAPQRFSAVGTFCNDISDHCAIACVRTCKIPKGKPRFIHKRRFKHFDEQAFLHDVFNSDLHIVSLMTDVELAWNYFKSTFLAICDKHAPFRTSRISGKDNPWFNDSISSLIRQRDTAWAKAKKSNIPLDWNLYRTLRNKCTKLIKNSKCAYYLNAIHDNLNNPAKFWKLVKSSSGSITPNSLPDLLRVNQSEIKGKMDIADSFNNHFISAGSIFDSSNSGMIAAEGEPGPPPLDPDQLFTFAPILTSQVHKALMSLDVKKSSGPDKIEPFFFKVAAGLIAEPITSILNLSLYAGELPSSWKSAMVLPLLKGGDPSDLNNYRPISRLSVMAKVFESLVNEQLKKFLTDHNILSESQSGFRSGHSTTSAAMLVSNDIIEALDKKKHCAALFVDLSKAFDSVDHALLLQRLGCIGLGKMALSWFKNYLSERTQCVSVEDYTSAALTINKGVPQGSILAPVLFSIFINELGNGINPARFHLYADDTVVYTVASSLTQAIELLQDAFNTLQHSLLRLRLVLNAKKTKYMTFSRSRANTAVPPILTLEGTCLDKVASYKYLGIWIDEKMAFDVHIGNLLRKLRPKLGFFFRLRKCFPSEARKRIVQSSFLSVLDYGDVIYMHASSSLLKKLDSAYHTAIRFVTGAGSRTHHCTLYQSLGWSSLYQRRQSHMLIFILKSLLGKLPLYISRLLSFYTCFFNTRRAANGMLLNVPLMQSELGKAAFSHYAPFLWNTLQVKLCLEALPTVNAFKGMLRLALHETCNCFT